MIDQRYITFLSLCETKNYTKTAELLFVTQPSVTNHIKALEKMYNIKLFRTSNKTFELTPEGELLYKYIIQLKAMDAQFERMLAACNAQKQHISFAITKNINNSFFKFILSKWSKTNADLSYSLKVCEYDEIVDLMSQGLIDFAIIDNRFNKRNFHSIQMHKTNLILAVNKKHHLAKVKKLSFGLLNNEPIILDSVGTGKRDFLESELKLHNRSLKDLNNLVEINCPTLVTDMVLSGGYASVFYKSEIEDEIRSGKLIPIEIMEVTNTVDFSLIYYKTHLSSKFIENLADNFTKLYNEFHYLKYTSS